MLTKILWLVSDRLMHKCAGFVVIVLASSLDFSALSKFEQWHRLADRLSAMPGTIDPHKFVMLEGLDVALKCQLLDWLENRRETASLARKVG
jgi:hypothetical protein